MRLTISILFALSVHLCNGQQFSVLYDYENYANDGKAILKTSNTYLSIHSAVNLENWNLTTIVSGHSLNSSIEWNYSLSSDTIGYGQTQGPNNPIIFIEEENLYLIICNRLINNEGSFTPTIFKINDNGQILDTITYDSLTELNLLSICAVRTQDFVYHLSHKQGTNLTHLIKLDLQANYLSHSEFQFGAAFTPLFIRDNGDGLVLGGRSLMSENANYQVQIIQKHDYEGNVIWTNIIDNYNLTSMGAVNAIPMDNGNILFAGTATSGQLLQERFRPMIGEIDNLSGDTLWTKKYFSPDSSYTLLNFKRLSTGEYIGVGEGYQPIDIGGFDFIATGFIMKLDSEFNLLWRRIYAPPDFTVGPTAPATCRLNDFVENEDGGITALGRAFTYTGTGPQSGSIQDSWLLRVDSEGCLVSGCAVDVTEYETNNELYVYPNPASDRLNIAFPHIDKWHVRIYNMQGALVQEEHPHQLLQYTMDVQALASGVYSLLCRDSQGKTFSHKIIKH